MISNPTNNSNTDKENKSNKESISIPKTLNDLTLDGLYKAKIDETIINWKNELDCHIDRFNMCGERLKNYELQLQGCFQITDPLAQLIEKVNTDTSTTLKELPQISLDEDDLLEHIDELEKTVVNISKSNQPTQSFEEKKEKKEEDVYEELEAMAKKMDEISGTIESIHSTVINHKKHSESLSLEQEESMSINVSLNELYCDFKQIQLTEQALLSKIFQLEKDIDMIGREGIKKNI